MNITPVLDIRNLSVDFAGQGEVLRVVDNISLAVNPGETLGLVGESGSGKSVTSLAVMQLLQKPAGRIAGGEILLNINGTQTDLVKLKEDEVRRYRGKHMAMIFQEPMTSLNPVLTCGYQVAEALMLHEGLNKKQARERCIELFDHVKLPRPQAIYDAYPHQLSGGQKQRVMIAMAISCKPQLLIADEPTTALDVTVQKSIIELLGRLQQEYGMGIIFISHDLGVVSDIASRVAVMYKGKMVENATAADIFKNPQHPYTKGLLACRPPMDKRLTRLPVVGDFMLTDTEGRFTETGLTVDGIRATLAVDDSAVRAQSEQIAKGDVLLKVENLKVYYPVKKGVFGRVTDHVKAVDDVSFNVYKGETLGLVGESGCGKTTLGRTVLRLLEATSGNVHFDGKDILALPTGEMRRLRREMQIIFQDPYSSLNPRLTIGHAISEPMLVHKLCDSKTAKARTIDLLEKVGLKAEHYNRYPHQFSGGQRQRVCIARALALNPKFIVCDESVSALDVSVQAQVLNLLNGLKNEFGFTYIFITHDMSVVRFMADRIMVMNKGKIEELGFTADVFAKPESQYTQKLIDAIPGGNV
jgi:peptide/nickel transport system ATP-binding protein